MFKTGFWIGLALLAVACAPIVGPEHPNAKPLAARLDLTFQSQLPELYYVLSGPAFTYGRFRVNDDFAGYLQQRLQAAAGPPGAPAGKLDVEVLSLTTGFDEVGAGPPAVHTRQLAMAGNPAGKTGFLLANEMEMDGDSNLPETTIKQATMTFRARLSLGGRVIAEQKLQASFTERYDWYYDHPAMQNWARYDYGSVLKGVYRQGWQQLRVFLDHNLG